MATKPRIKLPEQAKAGDIIEIKTLISHVMETGQRKDTTGRVIARDIITTFTASFAGHEFFKASLQPGISANPFLHFTMRVPGPGEFEFTWTDDAGNKITEKVKLNVV